MSVIEVLIPCECGKCDPHRYAEIDARNMHVDGLRALGFRPWVASEMADAITCGGMFAFPRPNRPERRNA